MCVYINWLHMKRHIWKVTINCFRNVRERIYFPTFIYDVYPTFLYVIYSISQKKYSGFAVLKLSNYFNDDFSIQEYFIVCEKLKMLKKVKDRKDMMEIGEGVFKKISWFRLCSFWTVAWGVWGRALLLSKAGPSLFFKSVLLLFRIDMQTINFLALRRCCYRFAMLQKWIMTNSLHKLP